MGEIGKKKGATVLKSRTEQNSALQALGGSDPTSAGLPALKALGNTAGSSPSCSSPGQDSHQLGVGGGGLAPTSLLSTALVETLCSGPAFEAVLCLGCTIFHVIFEI